MGKATYISPEELEAELLAMPADEVSKALDSHLKASLEELDAAYAEKPQNLQRKVKALGRMGMFSFAKAVLEGDERTSAIHPSWYSRGSKEILDYITEDPTNRLHLMNTDFFSEDPKHVRRLNRLIFVGIESRVRMLPENDRILAIEIAMDPDGIYDPTNLHANKN